MHDHGRIGGCGLTDTDNPDSVPSPVDEHVGQRLRQRRVALGLSQSDLAQLLGISFRQIQKYEKGANRVGASRLFDTARVLGVSIDYFFTEMPIEAQSAAADPPPGDLPLHPGDDHDLRREVIELIRAYQSITDPRIRRRVQDLAKVLAG
jgi:transcriptional regulator with XRE-family HTH domain